MCSSFPRTVAFLSLLSLLGTSISHASWFDSSSDELSQESLDKLKQHIEVVSIPVKRGAIVDRYGLPVAEDRSVVSVGCNPHLFPEDPLAITQLAELLNWSDEELKNRLRSASWEHIPLKRNIDLETQLKIDALKIPGVEFRRSMVRYYPAGESLAPLLGLIDSYGATEGLELAFDHWLTSISKKVRVLQDSAGNTIDVLDTLDQGKVGRPLQLSIDLRLQQLVYQSLINHLKQHNASSGSVVVLDSDRGEVLAIANYPSRDPNLPAPMEYAEYLRNRAVTDFLEPGSVMKPFTIAAAMESGAVNGNSVIDTSPGALMIDRKVIREYDGQDFGKIDLATIIEKSSNVGAAKVALMMRPEDLWKPLDMAGVGESAAAQFPGEASGVLRDYEAWRTVDQATLSYGYGLMLTPLQLARLYLSFAEDGVVRPITFLRSEEGIKKEYRRVFSEQVAKSVRLMMERTVEDGGIGELAQVEGARVAGASSSVEILVDGRYRDEEGKPFGYVSMFAGLAPVEDPKAVVVVVINDPKGEHYTGAKVAAPLFSEVMGGVMGVMSSKEYSE